MASWDSLPLCQYDDSGNDDFSEFESDLDPTLSDAEIAQKAWKVVDTVGTTFNTIDFDFWDNKRAQAKDHVKDLILSYWRNKNDPDDDEFVTDYIENPTILKRLAVFWSLHFAAIDLSGKGEDYFKDKALYYEKRAKEQWGLIRDRIEIDIDDDGYIDKSPPFRNVEIAI